MLETCNAIDRKGLKGAGLFPVCKQVSSWTVFLALPLRPSTILGQSQSFNSPICKLGLTPHLVTWG